MRLYLVRHGEARSKLDDAERPLSDHGRAEVESVASLLERAGVTVGTVLHSGKKRAEQTARILAAAVGGEPDRIGGIAPNDPTDEFRDVVESWTRDTMVVGHLPFMALLASLLLAGDEESASLIFQTGTVACLERESGDWHLAWLVPPEVTPG